MATIKDVALKAGVSMATVSKYLNGGQVRPQHKEKIRSAIEELQYRVNPFARGLKAQRSPYIGVLLPEIDVPFYGNVVSALEKVLREDGYHCIMSSYSSDHGLERDHLQFLLSSGIEGLVYIPEHLTAEEFYELTAHYCIPTVLVDRMIQGVDADCVLVNNAEAVQEAMERLIKKGHKRIAFVAGPQTMFTAKERMVGYFRSLSDHGILYDETLLVNQPTTFATGYQSAQKFMKLKNPPTAIVATNYDMTLGLISGLRDMELHIPEDVQVFGFDSVELSSILRTPLPIVYQPEEDIGKTAAKYLLDRLHGFTGAGRITRLNCTVYPKADA